MRTVILFLFSFLCFTRLNAQSQPRQLAAKRIDATIKIDGVLDEPVWKETTPAADFIEWRPNPGAKEDPTAKTEVYIVYDNTSIYIAGYCHERTKDSINKELVGRDVIGSNDYVGVIFDTYYDKINGFGFYVTPLGEQFDARYSSTNGEDGSWNAVWSSESRIHPDGWTFEMRIPYSALRFSNLDKQTWGLNITRNRKQIGRQYMWNPVDPKINGFMNQSGEWTGIEKIESPVRLSLSPYLSTYLNHYPNNGNAKDLTSSINGGMDVKYGISEAFTLDMTLIPDFGQVQSDNQVLNLTPFEVEYNENRAFFTEGTELFNKGDLFYSRRIGGMPLRYGEVSDRLLPGETLVKNPRESKLVNATKVSGRTSKGLGLGFFNAVTRAMYADVEDASKNRRRIETNPLTNYNILVLDQTLKNNSSVSFINTNVWRSGNDRDANVSAGLFDINNKKNTFNWSGKLSASRITDGAGNASTGYSHRLGFGKTGGRWNFQITQELADDRYDINDMGLLFNNNYLDHYFWTAYRWLKPGKWYNQIQLNYNANFSSRFKARAFQSFNTNVNGNIQMKNLWWAGFYVGWQPEGNDFYESRGAGVYRSPEATSFNVWIETNGARKYYVSVNFSAGYYQLMSGRSQEYSFFQRYRFNDKFSLTQSILYNPFRGNVGFYNRSGAQTIFSLRDRNTVENVLSAKYNFNNRSGITFRARHYWSRVKNRLPLELQPDGSVKPMTGTTIGSHQNFNIFNIDAVYTWQFAPGSFLNVVWKDESSAFDGEIGYRYFKNLNRTISAPQNNNLSLKVIYFLDYLDFKKWRSKGRG